MDIEREVKTTWRVVDNLRCIHALGDLLYECAGAGRHLDYDTLMAIGGMLLEKSKDALEKLEPPAKVEDRG